MLSLMGFLLMLVKDSRFYQRCVRVSSVDERVIHICHSFIILMSFHNSPSRYMLSYLVELEEIKAQRNLTDGRA